MTAINPPPGSADEGLGKVARGQRVREEVALERGHDGKERANFARPRTGELPPDMDTQGPAPVTVENVVDVDDAASAWEAIEDGDNGC